MKLARLKRRRYTKQRPFGAEDVSTLSFLGCTSFFVVLSSRMVTKPAAVVYSGFGRRLETAAGFVTIAAFRRKFS